MKLLIFILLSLSFNANAKLIDKIAGVINDKVFTLSELKRIQKTLGIRKEIAPFIFTQNKYTLKEILQLRQNSFIIKDKLEELGFIISDDSVEDRIKETERGLGLNRSELLTFLDSKGIDFNEYFEILREAMEYNIFNRRIIAPLVTITDQELKNVYYNDSSKAKALAFNYEVIDYSIPTNKIQKSDIKKLPNVLATYRKSGSLPEIYKDLAMDDLGKLSDEDLPKNLSKLLKVTGEKAFSKPIKIDNQIHVFFLVKKSLVESNDFLKAKPRLYNQIFLKRSAGLSKNWFSRESLNYYILDNL